MRPVFINSSPNTESDDVFLSLRLLLNPFSWRNDKTIQLFEEKVSSYFGTNAVAFDSARSSFLAILQTWGIGPGDEVIVPAFTCTVIVNPILWVGAKPIYADIDKETLNVNFDDLKSKITPKTKVILAQHTFGKPLNIEELVEFAHSRNIKVVEDCAHSLGLRVNGKHLGTFGDASVITFGMTKVISGVRGGMSLVHDKETYSKLKKTQENWLPFPTWKNFILLLNPIIWELIPPVYYFGIGKFTLGRIIVQLLQWFKIISVNNIVEKVEEKGARPDWVPRKMSGALAKLAMHQFEKLDKLNAHRRKIAQIYSRELGMNFDENNLYLRFPVMVHEKHQAFNFFRKNRIILGDWYKSILHIPRENYAYLEYQKGSCVNAEYAVDHVVNLPTNIKVGEEEAMRISSLIKQFQIK